MGRCLICGDSKGYGRKIKAKGFVYVICNNCGGATLIPRDKVLRTIKKIYRPEYYDWHDPDGFRKLLYKIRIFESYPDWITRVAGTSGNIMDVGAGVPRFLLAMKKRGWKPYAQELSKEQGRIIGKEIGPARVITGDFEQVKIPWRSLKVVTFWHALEHVRRPINVLKKTRLLLAPGGFVFTEMPNLNSFVWKLTGDNYSLLSIPEHPFCFSESSLRELFKVSGYEVLEVAYPLKYNTALASSFANYLSKKFAIEESVLLSFVYYIFMPPAFLLNILMSLAGRSEIIRVSARKKQ